MNAPDLTADIARRVAQLSPELQEEVLDFIEFVQQRRRRVARAEEWLNSVWGIAPDFPDRAPQPSVPDAASW